MQQNYQVPDKFDQSSQASVWGNRGIARILHVGKLCE